MRLYDCGYACGWQSSERSSTRDCGWLLIVYLFLLNLKTVFKSPYEYKSPILASNFFHLGIKRYCENRFRTYLVSRN